MKDINLEQFDSLYKALSVPSYGFLTEDARRVVVDFREDKILDLIKTYDLPYQVICKGESLILSKKSLKHLQNKKVMLISVHRDTVFIDTKAEDLASSYFKDENDPETLYFKGNIDNTIHIAISFYMMIHFDLPADVIFAFTLGEESSNFKNMPEYWMSGADETLEFLRKNNIKPKLALVLDICYLDPQSPHLTLVRNNYSPKHWKKLKAISNVFENKVGFIEKIGSNETAFYNMENIPTFNVTAPSNTASIHSLNAEISSTRVAHTIKYLAYLFKNLKKWYS